MGPDESGFSLCSNRSIDGGKICINRKDREDFLERLAYLGIDTSAINRLAVSDELPEVEKYV